STQVAAHHSQAVVHVQYPQSHAENQSNETDADGFNPNRAADLIAQSSDGLHHAKFTPAVGDRYRKRINDTQNRNKDGHHDLVIRHRKPLVRQTKNVGAHFIIGKHKQALPACERALDALSYLRRIFALSDVDTRDVHRIIAPPLQIYRSVDEDAALHVGVVANDSNYRKRPYSRRSWQLNHIAEFNLLQSLKTVGDNQSSAFRGQPIHVIHIAGNWDAMHGMCEFFRFNCDHHHRSAMDRNAGTAHQLHHPDSGHGLNDLSNFRRKCG